MMFRGAPALGEGINEDKSVLVRLVHEGKVLYLKHAANVGTTNLEY